MTHEEMNGIVSFLENNSIPYVIRMGGTNRAYYAGYQGSVIIWSKDHSTFTCIRFSSNQNQTENPYEICVVPTSDIEDIEFVTGDDSILEQALVASTKNAVAAQKASDAIIDYIRAKIGVSTNASTGDGVDWKSRIHNKPYKNFNSIDDTVGIAYRREKDNEDKDNEDNNGD